MYISEDTWNRQETEEGGDSRFEHLIQGLTYADRRVRTANGTLSQLSLG